MFIRMRKKKMTANATPALAAGGKGPLTLEEAKAKGALETANAAEQIEVAIAERELEQQKADLAAMAALKLPAVTTKKSELLSRELRETTKKDPLASAQVITTWLHDAD